MIKVITSLLFFLVIQGRSFGSVNNCDDFGNINYSEIFFEKISTNKFGVQENGKILSDIYAELENDILTVFRANVIGSQCILDHVDLNAIKVCPYGKWRLRKNDGYNPGWNVIGQSVFIMDTAYVADSSICGFVSIDSYSTINSSTIHQNYSRNYFELDIKNSTYSNVKQIISKPSSEDGASGSVVENSTLGSVQHKGSIKASGLVLNNASYEIEGDLICDFGRCYYRSNPCPEGENLYSNNFNIEPITSFFYDSLKFVMPLSGFYCAQKTSNLNEFLVTYSAPRAYQQWTISNTQEDNLESLWPEPSIQYEGCTYDGKISKSIYKYETTAPNVTSYPLVDYPVITSAICTEPMNNYQYREEYKLAEMYRGFQNVEPGKGYITLRGAPHCYKYRLFQLLLGSHRSLGDFIAKHEECSDCSPGKIKKGSNCICPEGYSLDPVDSKKCNKPIKCITKQEYIDGKCECAKPYMYQDVNGREIYSCIEPDKSYPFRAGNPASNPSITNVSFINHGCYKINNQLVNKLSLSVTKENLTRFNVYFFCSGKRSQVLSAATGTSDYGFLDSALNGTQYTKDFTIYPVGDCYDFKIRLIPPSGTAFNYYWEQGFSVNYSQCQSPFKQKGNYE